MDFQHTARLGDRATVRFRRQKTYRTLTLNDPERMEEVSYPGEIVALSLRGVTLKMEGATLFFKWGHVVEVSAA